MSKTSASPRSTASKSRKVAPAKSKGGVTPLIFATVVDIRIEATMTLNSELDLDDESDNAPQAEDSINWDDPDNRIGVIVATKEDGTRVLFATANCTFDFQKRNTSERVRHRSMAKGEFRLEGSFAKLEDGCELDLSQVWPYVSMVLWRLREHASEQLARFAQVKLDVKLPSVEDFDRSDE